MKKKNSPKTLRQVLLSTDQTFGAEIEIAAPFRVPNLGASRLSEISTEIHPKLERATPTRNEKRKPVRQKKRFCSNRKSSNHQKSKNRSFQKFLSSCWKPELTGSLPIELFSNSSFELFIYDNFRAPCFRTFNFFSLVHLSFYLLCFNFRFVVGPR